MQTLYSETKAGEGDWKPFAAGLDTHSKQIKLHTWRIALSSPFIKHFHWTQPYHYRLHQQCQELSETLEMTRADVLDNSRNALQLKTPHCDFVTNGNTGVDPGFRLRRQFFSFLVRKLILAKFNHIEIIWGATQPEQSAWRAGMKLCYHLSQVNWFGWPRDTYPKQHLGPKSQNRHQKPSEASQGYMLDTNLLVHHESTRWPIAFCQGNSFTTACAKVSQNKNAQVFLPSKMSILFFWLE